MKVPMSRVTIYGNKRERKSVLEFLQRRKIIDISERNTEDEQLGFSCMNTCEYQSEFSHDAAMGVHALEILDKYVPKKKGMFESLNGRNHLSVSDYYKYVEDVQKTMDIAKEIISLEEQISERNGHIVRCTSAIEEIRPWLGLDVPMKSDGTKNSIYTVGTFGGEISAEEITEKYNKDEKAPPVYIETISCTPQQTCVFAVCGRKHYAKCENRLREIGFSKPKISCEGIPYDEVLQLRQNIMRYGGEISSITERIISYENMRNSLKFMIDYYNMRAEKYDVLGKLNQSKRVFIINGYVPTVEVAELTAVLEHKYKVAVEYEDADENAPVLLKNGHFSEPAEGVVETFSMPGKGEIDPTSIMSVFYYIFFGLMLSDAGYGLLMTVGCGVVLTRFKNMEKNIRKTLRMFLYCGMSTIFWGVLFGGYFGDAISVISSTFFGKEITVPPLWFEPVKDPMKMLMFSFLLGVIHLFTALGIKLYQCIKAHDIWAAFTDCIFWFMLVGGAIVYLFRIDMFITMAELNFKLPALPANIAAIVAGLGALGILIFTARNGNVGKRFAKGAYALYGATSWLSDILSYSRLLALGLATGVIATVFNKMGSMFGGGIVGAIIFTAVFLLGHALNIGVNLLGAYVHTNRLQFVEFFGKFFEGGGKPFNPFNTCTKYFKFEEDNYNE